MPLPFYFQVWTEEGYLASYSTERDAIWNARRDHETHNSYTTVYRSTRAEGRPDARAIVWTADPDLERERRQASDREYNASRER